ncbi:hypothetical protein BJ138DRAFT_1129774 [Hygrophoropsis aurantiaca]|uniref:Uncharacterized protein n=1 Tax=Hygrophoropsis aurantiaca TaxID=72124 RepID=A0ACB8A086_9AGAM|nr:hypothetical protein BJ138DRAFT_1129774 [Hygrophoropsis aurantiaca]
MNSLILAPAITITDATPPKSFSSSINIHAPNTPTSNTNSYRLLYRGAISLPDSDLLLDGLTFTAKLDSTDLLHNQLALALESMRGRPSLRFKGTANVKDVWLDTSGEVCMDIHPFATLSRVYFENMICLAQTGVRVALGDTDGPETTDILIYGEPSTELLPSTSTAPPIVIRVARITTAPRPPRPDDPTPRRPPAHLRLSSKHKPVTESTKRPLESFESLGASKRIRKAKDAEEDEVVKRAREVMTRLPKPGSQGTVFKIPALPRSKSQSKISNEDVFGAIEPGKGKNTTSVDKGKGKGREINALPTVPDSTSEFNATEEQNKTVVKKTAVKYLAAAGIDRSHPEFKDIFGFVYRGAAFALRAKIKSSQLCRTGVDTLVETHVKLYVVEYDDQGGAVR